MKLISRFLIIIFLFSFIQTGNSKGYPGEGTELAGWKLITESAGIKMYERWVKLDKDVKVRERSGKMTLHSTVEEVVKLISDASKAHLWMSNVEDVKILKSVSSTEWYQRTVLDAPWPFSKQDMVSRYIVERDSKNDKVIIKILRETKLFPKQKGVDRLDSFNAEWIVENVKESKVKITFTTKSTKPPKYPAWAQDPVVRNMFFSNLKNFKKVILEKS